MLNVVRRRDLKRLEIERNCECMLDAFRVFKSLCTEVSVVRKRDLGLIEDLPGHVIRM